MPHVTLSGVPNLPQQNLKTAVVVDAKYMFVAGPSAKTKSSARDEIFGEVFRNHLPTDMPTGTHSIHLCCDGYNPLSLKSLEQQHI